MNKEILDDKIITLTRKLRQTLHSIPELSGQEVKTRQQLQLFLSTHTTVEIHDFGTWFYAVHRAKEPIETIVFRADHDAILHPNGQPFHGCGHDGHSAILAGLALYLENIPINKTIIYLFQPSEENGLGAKECLQLFTLESVDRIYGMHNFPGFELGEILTRSGTIMCASVGMSISFNGKQTHAATPEQGLNPAYAIANLISYLAPLSEFKGYQPLNWESITFSSMVLATIISSQIGHVDHFGISPDNGHLQLTLRAERYPDLKKLIQAIEFKVESLCLASELSYKISFNDEFIEASNHEKEIEDFLNIMSFSELPVRLLDEPFRPSEDFGQYLVSKPGIFFGLGSGKSTPPLHDSTYEFPDDLLSLAMQAFSSLAINS